jgi:hypothetical protein
MIKNALLTASKTGLLCFYYIFTTVNYDCKLTPWCGNHACYFQAGKPFVP